MAYVFSQIKDALGKDQQIKQNIFAPSQNPNQSAGDGSAMGMTPKTSTEGELAGSTGTGTAQSSEGMPSDVKANDQRVVRNNKMGVPGFANQAQEAIGAAEKGIQDEANSYTQNAAATDYKIREKDIEKAIRGDETRQQSVRDRLGGDASLEAQKYGAFEPKTGYTVDDIEQMRTDEGTKGLLRRNAGANYNAGESAFDMMLLNRTPEFNTIRSALGQRQDNLNKQVGDFRTSKTDEARKAIEANYKAGQEQVSGYLGSKSSELLKAQEAEAAAENAARAALRKTGNKDLTEKQSAALLEQIKKENAGNDPSGMLRHLGSGVDARDFYSVGDDVDYNAAIDAKEAARFNTINSLLGKSDSWQAGGGFGERERFRGDEFRTAASRAAMDADEKANARAEAALKAQMDAIGARSSGVDAYRQKQMAAAQAELQGLYGDVYDPNAIDAGAYNKDVDWRNFVTQADIVKMNPYYEELGQSAVGVGKGLDATFDLAGYRTGLEGALKGRRAEASARAKAEEEARLQRERSRTVRVGGKNGVPIGVTTGHAQQTRGQDYRTGTPNKGSQTAAQGAQAAAERAQHSAPAREVDKAVNTAKDAGKKADPSKWCFPAGVRFRMEDGTFQDIATIGVGDVMSEGGRVSVVHEGESESLYLLGSALVTGDHPVLMDGAWMLVKDVDEAFPVAGSFKVYSVTNAKHHMLHESGLMFGDFEADEIFGVEE